MQVFPMIGKTLGHYSVSALLGKGGMGEVYKAKDQKLGREVAIKILPEEFAKDSDRVARFQREAKLLASLNHPNIAAIYGLEESAGTNFLVLELVEGDTLADRIKAGPIPVEESLKLALQIAEALEAAHEKGVIHRDLKPANIKVTPEGKAKVLDFGLAKAFAGEQEQLNLSNSPTLSNAATQQGVILGTAAYMSPEQARGKPVDKRADIWAFGCVLYEMLTGQAAFQGEDVTEILASVVKAGVNLDLLPANIHPRVREVTTRCLQKEQKKRYGGIGEAHYEIEKVLSDPSGVFVQPVTGAEPRKKLRLSLPWVASIAVLCLAIAGAAVWNLKPSEPRRTVRFYHDLPEGQQFTALNRLLLAVSPDGTQFVYSTTAGLYLRSLEQTAARLIPGTDQNSQQPVYSPDGKWICYWSAGDNQLKKIAVSGGAPVTLCGTTDPRRPTWSVEDTIVFGSAGGIMRVSPNGGTPELLIKAEADSLADAQILPGGKAVLFTIGAGDLRKIAVQSLKSGERKELFAGDSARYLPTGHIIYSLRTDLFAIPFDVDKLETRSGSFSMVEGVFRRPSPYAPSQYAFSDSGMLAYVSGATGDDAIKRTLVWVDRKGKEEPLSATPNNYREPRISPDGTKVALTILGGEKQDVWIWDLVREAMPRLTFNEGSICALWTPDGKRIAFAKRGAGRASVVYWKAADGTGEEEKLGSAPNRLNLPWSWSGDGHTLALFEVSLSGQMGYDIGTLSMKGNHEWKPLLNQKHGEVQPKISPDGKWIAYASSESGKLEIYVRPFPEVNKGRWQVSTSGGNTPLWSPSGRELFYLNEDAVMRVPVESGPAFNAGKPETLFRGAYVRFSALDGQPWDINPDGKRFLMIKEPAAVASAGGGPSKINIVINWFEELKQRVPVK
jgi:serine/threonine-protein kinase